MATKNLALSELRGKTYTEIVFDQVWGKVESYQATHPEQEIFMMALGDTTKPLPSTVVKAIVEAANRLGNSQTYTGYEDITGNPALRSAICTDYYQKKIGIEIDSSEVFISDGAQ